MRADFIAVCNIPFSATMFVFVRESGLIYFICFFYSKLSASTLKLLIKLNSFDNRTVR